mmetsp:Transcript_137924/g.384644  ORF Transcript_137924/g.384644 Transcript_137924/m.384644 type:complete len:311 (-) Transcript_137924:120-1052(-)
MMIASSLENYLSQLELLGILCWLLKDLGWVLLCPAVAFPAGFAALCLETYSITALGGVETVAEFTHRLAVLLWLIGNAVWMVSELLFEPSVETGHRFPWFQKPMLGVRPDASNSLLHVAEGILAMGLSVLLVLYAWGALTLLQGDRRRPDQPEQKGQTGAQAKLGDAATEQAGADWQPPLVAGLVTVRVYQWVFIGPWLAKDFFWTFEWLNCALIFGFVVVAVIIDCIRRFGSVVFVAELMWAVSNIIWIYGELGLKDASHRPRVLAAAVLVADCLLMMFAIHRAYRRPGSKDPTEDSPLIDSTSRSLRY